MTEHESEMVAALGLLTSPAIAAALTAAGDGWFGVDRAGQAARLAVTAWAMAVNGDDSTLAPVARLPPPNPPARPANE